ncbi:MAG: PQQ-binding-like beta-propeller repeat protein, partial [Pirellulales bacterium]
MRYTIVIIALSISVFAANLACAQHPVYFRHDNGLADDDAQALPDELDPARAQWKQPLPPGASTPTIVGERMYLTGNDGDQLITLCLDRTSGKELWRHGIRVEKVEKVHTEGSPAAATVACDGQRVFAFFGSLGLLCFDVDGKPLWTKKLGPFQDEFGASSSPILVDDKVILSEDHDLNSFVIAIRRDDGETLWQTPRDGFTRSYSTPVVWNGGGRKQLVVAGSLQLVGYDLAGGNQLWSLDGFARIVNTTPVAVDGTLFVASWSPGGDTDARIAMEPWETALSLWDKNKDGILQSQELPAGEVQSRFFRIDLDGSQSLDEVEWNKYARVFELAQNAMVALKADPAGGPPQIAWEYKRGIPYVASPLIYRDRVILVKDGGGLTALDATSGEVLYEERTERDRHRASPVWANGNVYTTARNGTVTVTKAGRTFEM